MKKERIPVLSDMGCTSEIMSDEVTEYAKMYNDRYLHWNEVRYKDTGRSSPECVWYRMKMIRHDVQNTITIGGIVFHYSLINQFHRQLHMFDMHPIGCMDVDITTDRTYPSYITSVESISSSQIEGANIGTDEARMMLIENRNPKNESEIMITNCHRAMDLMRSRTESDLTPDVIKEYHRTLMKGLIGPRCIGEFRDNDDIVVMNIYDGNVSHHPPSYRELDGSISQLCDFINNDDEFTHPVIKSIILHFMIGYFHPFEDGNGRLARLLFCWCMLRNGYQFMDIISLSSAIKKHLGNYGKAYEYTESDENDMTYFIKYNLDMIEEAISDSVRELKNNSKERISATSELKDYNLNSRQQRIISDLMNSGDVISTYGIRERYKVSLATARNDVAYLKRIGLLEVGSKEYNRLLYRYSGRK